MAVVGLELSVGMGVRVGVVKLVKWSWVWVGLTGVRLWVMLAVEE